MIFSDVSIIFSFDILLITRKKTGSIFLTFGLMLEYMTHFIVQCSFIASVHKSYINVLSARRVLGNMLYTYGTITFRLMLYGYCNGMKIEGDL
jgi:hypothetical protein